MVLSEVSQHEFSRKINIQVRRRKLLQGKEWIPAQPEWEVTSHISSKKEETVHAKRCGGLSTCTEEYQQQMSVPRSQVLLFDQHSVKFFLQMQQPSKCKFCLHVESLLCTVVTCEKWEVGQARHLSSREASDVAYLVINFVRLTRATFFGMTACAIEPTHVKLYKKLSTGCMWCDGVVNSFKKSTERSHWNKWDSLTPC